MERRLNSRMKIAGVRRAPLAVPNTTMAVAAALLRHSTCVPDGMVLLSMSNPHHRPLREMQFERVRHIDCLMTRVVSVCWGGWTDGLGTCVAGDCDAAGDEQKNSACNPSDYRRGQCACHDRCALTSVCLIQSRLSNRCLLELGKVAVLH